MKGFRNWWRQLTQEQRPAPSERVLVCMRLDEMLRVHPKQITRYCHKCHEQVGIYPSGQNILRQYPDTRIVCNHCNSDPYGQLAPGAEHERFESKWREDQ